MLLTFISCLLVCPDGNIIFNEDDRTLSSYSGIDNNAVFLLLILPPFVVYVQAVDGRKHTITVKSAQPDVSSQFSHNISCTSCCLCATVQSYPVSSLMRNVEVVTGCSLSTHQLFFQDKPLQPTRHGKSLTLRDCRIRKEETLFVQKMGFTLNITNPQVQHLRFMLGFAVSLCTVIFFGKPSSCKFPRL